MKIKIKLMQKIIDEEQKKKNYENESDFVLEETEIMMNKLKQYNEENNSQYDQINE